MHDLKYCTALLNTRIWLIFLLFTQGAMYMMKVTYDLEKKQKKKHANWNHMHAIFIVKLSISANAVM